MVVRSTRTEFTHQGVVIQKSGQVFVQDGLPGPVVKLERKSELELLGFGRSRNFFQDRELESVSCRVHVILADQDDPLRAGLLHAGGKLGQVRHEPVMADVVAGFVEELRIEVSREILGHVEPESKADRRCAGKSKNARWNFGKDR